MLQIFRMADRSCALSYRVPRSRTLVCRSTWIATTKKLRPTFYWASMVWPTQYVSFSNRSRSIERESENEKSIRIYRRSESADVGIRHDGVCSTADGGRCNQAANRSRTRRRTSAARQKHFLYGFGKLWRKDGQGRSVFGGIRHGNYSNTRRR